MEQLNQQPLCPIRVKLELDLGGNKGNFRFDDMCVFLVRDKVRQTIWEWEEPRWPYYSDVLFKNTAGYELQAFFMDVWHFGIKELLVFVVGENL